MLQANHMYTTITYIQHLHKINFTNQQLKIASQKLFSVQQKRTQTRPHQRPKQKNNKTFPTFCTQLNLKHTKALALCVLTLSHSWRHSQRMVPPLNELDIYRLIT